MTLQILLASLATLLSMSPKLADNTETSGTVGVSSSFLWAGNMYGAPGLTPELETSYLFNDNISFDISLGGYFDFGNPLYLPGAAKSPYNALDAFMGFSFGNLSIYAGDEFAIGSLRNSDENVHYWSAGLDWTISEVFPLTFSVFTVLHSKGDYQWISDEEESDKQAHSTLILVSYPFSIGESFEFGPEVGMAPWQSPFCDYYASKPGVTNIGLFGTYAFAVGDYSMPLGLRAGWNTYYNSPYAALSLNIEF